MGGGGGGGLRKRTGCMPLPPHYVSLVPRPHLFLEVGLVMVVLSQLFAKMQLPQITASTKVT